MTTISEPWQKNPAELIRSALAHHHQQSDINQIIAFLLLDVGVESTFKTFLLLPDTVTGVKTKYFDRKSAAEGSFHRVLQGVSDSAGPRLSGFNLARVHYYHGLRNQLYHQGNGITIPKEQVKEYAHLAVGLIRVLLGIDLTVDLQGPEIEAQLKANRQAQTNKEIRDLELQINAVKEARRALKKTARAAVERVHFSLALPSFERQFEEIVDEYNRLEGIGQEDVVFERKMSNLLLASTGVPELVDVITATELTEFRLGLLQSTISKSGLLIRPQVEWPGFYSLAAIYPDAELQPIHSYDESRSITDTKYLDHAEILEQGRQYVWRLNEIREAIESWVKIKS